MYVFYVLYLTMTCQIIITIMFWLKVGLTWVNAFEGQTMMMIKDWPVLKVLSNCGLRHQAQDQAEGILKLQRIPGWSEQWHNQKYPWEDARESKKIRRRSLLRCFLIQPGLELLKREAGSKLTQPGVSAAPTKHSLTISSQRKKLSEQLLLGS